MNPTSMIKPVLIFGALFVLYEWLKSSGLWGQLTGGSQSISSSASQQFTTTSDLLKYCAANPNASAGINGQNAPCSQWLSAASSASVASPPQPSGTTPPATAPVIDQTLAANLTNMMQSSQGRTMGTVSEWNWLYTHLENNPNAPILVGASQAEQSVTMNQQITASQYLTLRSQAGLSGLKFAGMGIVVSRGGLKHGPRLEWVH